MHKAKKKYGNPSQETLTALRNIKQSHKPMDYDKLRSHDKTFLAEMYKKKEEKIHQMKVNMKKLESTYEIPYKSPTYLEFESNFPAQRHSVPIKLTQTKTLISKSRDYGNEQLKLPSLARQKIDQNLKKNFPAEGKNYVRWFFGRFGREEWNKSVELQNSSKLVKLRYAKGCENFDTGKVVKATKEIIAARLKKRLENPTDLASPTKW